MKPMSASPSRIAGGIAACLATVPPQKKLMSRPASSSRSAQGCSATSTVTLVEGMWVA